ncbi:hypothetical protein I4J47_12605 [Corynebacterium belfantii]|nr:hypothetical protein [Corynebacterium belfantii]
MVRVSLFLLATPVHQDRVNFRTEIKKAITTVTKFCPDAGITADLKGVTIQRGQPSITIKPKKELG